MTSEVVVMNRFGVALAADSAVTVDIDGSVKMRDSALKLFTLSKYHPVGVMVYNNATLLGVPMETIIKLFRRDLGRQSFNTLAEYGEALIGFLDGNASLFPEAAQDHYFLRALEMEYRRIEERVKDELVDRGLYGQEESELEEDKIVTVDKVITERLQFWQQKKDAEYYSGVDADATVRRLSGEVDGLAKKVLLDLSVGGEIVESLYEIARYLVIKDYFPPDVHSGIVIAGFGEKEHFPVVQHLEIGGVYSGKLKVNSSPLVKASYQNPSSVMAFAHKDMVSTFLNGISLEVSEHLDDAMTFIGEMPPLALNTVVDLAPEEKKKLVEEARIKSLEKAAEFEQKILEGFIRRREQITRVVEALTIKELAHVASTLVGLNSFGQQMSGDRETVGGPVDVAVISKGDGFIWIDRKHYFRRELNEHFFRNYYDDSASPMNNTVNGDNNKEVQDGK